MSDDLQGPQWFDKDSWEELMLAKKTVVETTKAERLMELVELAMTVEWQARWHRGWGNGQSGVPTS